MIEKELRANWDSLFYPQPDDEPEGQTFGEEVEPVEPPVLNPPTMRPGDVLVAEVGSRGLPEQAFTGRYPDTITAIDPTMREKISSFLQAGFENAGMDRARARKQAQTLIGGASSNLPLDIGLADILAAIFPPATLAMSPLYVQEGARAVERGVEAAQQGRPGEAALEVAAGAADVIPGAVGATRAAKEVAKGAKALAPKAAEMAEQYLTKTGGILKAVPDGQFIKREEFSSYMNQPRQLQGFRSSAPSKSFEEQKYKHAEFLEIKLDDGSTFIDAIRGLNRDHAMSRAFGNWPSANEIKILNRDDATKVDPNLVKEVDDVMGNKNTGKKVASRPKKGTMPQSTEEPK